MHDEHEAPWWPHPSLWGTVAGIVATAALAPAVPGFWPPEMVAEVGAVTMWRLPALALLAVVLGGALAGRGPVAEASRRGAGAGLVAGITTGPMLAFAAAPWCVDPPFLGVGRLSSQAEPMPLVLAAAVAWTAIWMVGCVIGAGLLAGAVAAASAAFRATLAPAPVRPSSFPHASGHAVGLLVWLLGGLAVWFALGSLAQSVPGSADTTVLRATAAGLGGMCSLSWAGILLATHVLAGVAGAMAGWQRRVARACLAGATASFWWSSCGTLDGLSWIAVASASVGAVAAAAWLPPARTRRVRGLPAAVGAVVVALLWVGWGVATALPLAGAQVMALVPLLVVFTTPAGPSSVVLAKEWRELVDDASVGGGYLSTHTWMVAYGLLVAMLLVPAIPDDAVVRPGVDMLTALGLLRWLPLGVQASAMVGVGLAGVARWMAGEEAEGAVAPATDA